MYLRRFFPVLMLALLSACASASGVPSAPRSASPGDQADGAAPPARATSAPTTASAEPASTAEPTAAAEPPTAEPAAAPAEPAGGSADALPDARGGGARRPQGGEVLFLSKGALVALSPQTGAQRRIAEGVSDFAATPDGEQIALIRGAGLKAELWTVRRDGGGLTRLTNNDRAEAAPSWSPEGLSLVFGSSTSGDPLEREWGSWSRWCAASEVRLINLGQPGETTLAAGCDPAFAPDGLRIAYATPPTSAEPGMEGPSPLSVNALRLINRKGQNGWNLARAAGPQAPAPNTGRVLYAPAWSPDGKQVLYQRFLGYQALVDLNISELAGSLDGKSQPVLPGAGWLLPARFSPDGRSVAISERNFGDARGLSGYDIWSVTVLRLEGSRSVALPSGEVTMFGTVVETLERAQAAAWSPDGASLAVQLPPGWRPDLPADEPVDADGQPGELWLWQPGAPPSKRLAAGVDFASPLAWLPPAPLTAKGSGVYQLVYPADWRLAAPGEFEERTAVAPDGLRTISAAPVPLPGLDTAAVTAIFPRLVSATSDVAAPAAWPDGSVYRAFSGKDTKGRSVAGAVRTVSGTSVAAVYITTPERWPTERAFAQALLARSGPAKGR